MNAHVIIINNLCSIRGKLYGDYIFKYFFF